MTEPTAEERIAAVQFQARGVQFEEDAVRVSGVASETAEIYEAMVGGPAGLIAYAAEQTTSQLGSELASSLNSAEHVADALDFLGMRRIGQPGPGGPNPAAAGHKIAHSFALLGFLAGIAIGAAVAIGAAFLLASAGPVVALIGAAAAGGIAESFASDTLVGALSQLGATAGMIITGSPNVYLEGRPIARVTDTAFCMQHLLPPSPIVEGCATVFANGLNVARVGHKLLCGSVVDEGAPSVVIDDRSIAIAAAANEIPAVVRIASDWIDLIPGISTSSSPGPKGPSPADTDAASSLSPDPASPPKPDPPLLLPPPKPVHLLPPPSTQNSLNQAQTQNLNRFESSLPKKAEATQISDLPDGGKIYSAKVPGNVPGSYAIYEKHVNAAGKTTKYLKTTVDPHGNIVHTKQKFP